MRVHTSKLAAARGRTLLLVGVAVLALGVFASASAPGVSSRPATAYDPHLLAHPELAAVPGLLAEPAAASFPERRNGKGLAGAGGRAVRHHAGAVPVRGKAVGRTPEARLYRVGVNGWEPTIGVDGDGRVFYQARTPELQPEVMRSTNGGDTWESASPKIAGAPAQPLSLDPILWVDKDTDRVFTNNIPPTLTCQPVSFSDDGGGSWTTSGICGHFDHQNIFTGPPVTSTTSGYPNIVYYCAINLVMLSGSSVATTCGKSLDGGMTFVHTGEPAFVTSVPPRKNQTGTVCNGAVGHGHADREGVIYLPRVWCGQPYVAVSRDEGLTWEQVQVSTNGGVQHEAGVVADDKGNVYFTWIGTDRLPYLAISRDGARTFGKPMMIAPPGVRRTSLPAIDIGADGRIAIAYAGSETATQDVDEMYWNGYITMTTDALAARPVFYSGSINDRADPLTVGNCGERCTTLGDFFDVTIGPDGTPWAAFVDGCDGKDKCITTFEATGVRGEGIVGRLVGGPSLGKRS